MAGRKRAESLDERLAAIRTATPEDGPAPAESAEPPVDFPSTESSEPAESSESLEVPESLEVSEHSDAAASHESPAAFYTFSSIAPPPPAPVEHRASDVMQDVMQEVAEPQAAVPTPLSAAAEGDTFLPGSAAAANRVDVAVAVQAAVRQLWPELEQAEKPVELEIKPEETPLFSKLLGRGWKSARRASHERREENGGTAGEQPVEDAPAVDEVDEIDDVDEARIEPTTGDANELEDIIAEIAEITEVVTPAPWKPVGGRIPKPKSKPVKKPDPVVDEVAEAVSEPEPEVAAEAEAKPDPLVDETVEEPVVSLVETVDAAKVDYSAEAEAAALQIDEADEGPIVGLVNALMGQAITDHASDLHIEPCSTHIAIRMRIDGVLHDSSTVPLELLRPVVSRVKILAGLDIAQNRLAQDGRFSLTIDGRSVDVRVVTMPTAAGEAVILSLLDPIRDALGISSLGLSPAERDRFIPAFTASQGAVFIAGPTGSGKTSTIYAVLSEVNTRTKSIVSVENPVEFRLDGIKQMQINARAGLTFPTALPTVLRSDPDVVFIGEVRDTDTARIAADAAITGHLVLSTLHATGAASAPMRLVEMGVEPYLVASALTLVASQRLARRLCEHCAEPAEETTIERLRGLGADDSVLEGATVRRSVGCPACRGTGHQGRLPIFEIMPVTEAVSRLILDRASRAQIEDVAVEEGMDTMLRAAIKRVVRGDLSVEEMLRVIS